jgi:hypothetical protein
MLRKNWKSSFFIGSVTFEGWMFMKALAIVFAGLVLNGLLENGESFGAAASDATQTVSGGGVTAKITYLNPKSSDEPRFQVVLDTHSVALDSYDLKAISLLRDDTGKTYLPNAVENKGSGHHREVILTFPKVSPEAKRLEIVIKDVAGVKERTFRWNLE